MTFFYILFVSLIYIRFFTETLDLLPRSLQFLDIFFVLIIFILVIIKKENVKYIYTIIIYLVLILLNSAYIRVDISFLAMLSVLGPLGVYLFFRERINRLDKKNRDKILIWYVIGYIIQIAIGIVQIPTAISVSPDSLSGTFGVNNTQMQIFILGGSAYFLAKYLQKNKIIDLILSLALAILFYLGGWRAMFIAPIIVFSVVMLSYKKSVKALLIFPVAIIIFVTSFFVYTTYIDTFIDEYKYRTYIENIFLSTKFKSFNNVLKMYEENPETILIGSGPGTYGSRAFQTFSDKRGLRDNKTDAVSAAFDIQPYTNYYEQKYLYSYDVSTFMFGSVTSDSPFNSYASFLAEYGLIFGGFIIFSIFIIIKRVYLQVVKYRHTDLFPLYANVLATLIATTFASLLNDYWGIFRVTIPIAILLAYSDTLSKDTIVNDELPK